MRILGLSSLVLLFLLVLLISSAAAARHATPSGQVVHTRRAPVAMHRMSPPYRGNHVYEKPQADVRQARGERSDAVGSPRSDREGRRTR